MKYKHLYIAWGVLFALCAALGFVSAPKQSMLILMRILTAAYFIPPVWILVKARRENAAFHIRLIRNLAIAWLAATAVLLCANLVSVGSSQLLGNMLYALLTVICSPLVCSNTFLLPIFLWGMVLSAALMKKK